MGKQLKARPEDVIHVERYTPNYRRHCIACSAQPTVEAINLQGKQVRIADLCGPCTFGTARAADVDAWNHLDDD